MALAFPCTPFPPRGAGCVAWVLVLPGVVSALGSVWWECPGLGPCLLSWHWVSTQGCPSRSPGPLQGEPRFVTAETGVPHPHGLALFLFAGV